MGEEIYPNLFLTEASGIPMFSITETISVNELVAIDLTTGDGASVSLQDTLEVNYLGVGGSSGFSFDSSFARNEPAVFPLQAVILGWQEGLVGMKEGGRRVLVIPGNKAYGPTPPPGSGIEPNETLIFLVDLIKIN
jgi:peptidylprolyl isomerase